MRLEALCHFTTRNWDRVFNPRFIPAHINYFLNQTLCLGDFAGRLRDTFGWFYLCSFLYSYDFIAHSILRKPISYLDFAISISRFGVLETKQRKFPQLIGLIQKEKSR